MMHATNRSESRPDERLARTLERIEHRLSVIEQRLLPLETLGTRIPQALAVLTDTFDDHVDALSQRGIDVEERRQLLLRIFERLTAPEALVAVQELLKHVDTIATLLDSGVLDPGPVRMVARAGQALATAAETEGRERVGAFGLLRALGDPDVQRAAGLAIRFAQALGSDTQPEEMRARLQHARTSSPRLPQDTKGMEVQS